MSPEPAKRFGSSLPPGMSGDQHRADSRAMSAAVLTNVASAGSSRLLADVEALAKPDAERDSAMIRLEAALGRDFADRLVAALSTEPER